MSTLVGAVGAGSLDGFAIGALVSGTCFLAITVRKRQAETARYAPVTAGGWLREHVTAAETLGSAGGYRSRHRLGDPVPGRAPRDAAFPGALPGSARPGMTPPDPQPPDATIPDGGLPRQAIPGGAHRGRSVPGGALPDGGLPAGGSRRAAFPGGAHRGRSVPGEAFPDGGLPAGVPRRAAFPDSAFPGRSSRERSRPGAELPDLSFPDGSFGTARRPDARRLPRHAAPAVGLSSKVNNWMAGLLNDLALASGAHG